MSHCAGDSCTTTHAPSATPLDALITGSVDVGPTKAAENSCQQKKKKKKKIKQNGWD
jgi:hypothetical protein